MNEQCKHDKTVNICNEFVIKKLTPHLLKVSKSFIVCTCSGLMQPTNQCCICNFI